MDKIFPSGLYLGQSRLGKRGRRKWLKFAEKRIKAIHHFLKKNIYQFYTGATAVEQEWRRRHPETSHPPLRTIGQILKDLGLSRGRRKDRHRRAAKYLCYPEYTIYELFAGRILESDFIGKKYLAGRTNL